MIENLLGLAGKNVVVIGGGQGMGESAARLLAQCGCNIAVLDLDPARASTVADSLRPLGVTSVGIDCDVTSTDDLDEAMSVAETAIGPIDHLVCIVGMATWRPLLELSEGDWNTDLQRNVGYVLFAAKHFTQSRVDAGLPGSIACISSVDGIRSAAYHAAYGASKAALINLVKSMAAEWSPYGIRVNAIAPGTIVTPRFPLRDRATEAAQTKLIPANRRGEVDDIGKVVVFLLSELASYVTGQTIAVDGGYTSVGPQDYAVLADSLKA